MRNIHRSGAKSTRFVTRAWKNLSSKVAINSNPHLAKQLEAIVKTENTGRQSGEIIHATQKDDNRTVVRVYNRRAQTLITTESQRHRESKIPEAVGDFLCVSMVKASGLTCPPPEPQSYPAKCSAGDAGYPPWPPEADQTSPSPRKHYVSSSRAPTCARLPAWEHSPPR